MRNALLKNEPINIIKMFKLYVYVICLNNGQKLPLYRGPICDCQSSHKNKYAYDATRKFNHNNITQILNKDLWR